MDIMLYHSYLPESHEFHVPLEEILTFGIKSNTKSNNRYSNGGKVKIEITEKLKPKEAPDWIDFRKAVGADLTNRFSKSFCFPLFTNKVLVFNGEVSINIYDQAFYEDLKDTDEEVLNFDTGRSIEHWIKEYWESMVTLEQYFQEKPYSKPEILIFEDVPEQIIRECE
ncbi:DNA polymerase III [Lottiidibacillus patelloidae]|uniref:DNA polymerase III n=2 Tax=Lottiidibacillus patelloidae TaxID=2670334 RepID=A0A263BYE9_9BACI|nr:DNA polymerase III [Lottiidibacillus patelloidae]OZM58753.1 DNA polymerase III [Lottiidibacillus patelloidae]